MLKDEVACWMTAAQPQLVNLGLAAHETYQRIDKVLQFFENTEVHTHPSLSFIVRSSLVETCHLYFCVVSRVHSRQQN